jgi:2-polyprenyl-6-methoxyphenol hydroxylase-like FAD-dependent oxidoreductase
MMLGLVLACAGVDIVVPEKHKDFLRDLRGDTIHPSTLDVIHERGLLCIRKRRAIVVLPVPGVPSRR